MPPTPWLLSPLFWSWLLTLIIGWVVARDIMKGSLFLPLYAVWFFILGLAGCLVAFLVFVSVHESTSPNILIFWLNPFQFLFSIAVWWRKLHPLARAMAWYNFVVTGVVLIIYPFLTQSFNPAFFPLLLSTLGLALSYAINKGKISYRKR